jgi:hypothetical protein
MPFDEDNYRYSGISVIATAFCSRRPQSRAGAQPFPQSRRFNNLMFR